MPQLCTQFQLAQTYGIDTGRDTEPTSLAASVPIFCHANEKSVRHIPIWEMSLYPGLSFHRIAADTLLVNTRVAG